MSRDLTPVAKDPQLAVLLDRLKKASKERSKLFPEEADSVTRKAVEEVHKNLETQVKKPRDVGILFASNKLLSVLVSFYQRLML